MSLDDKIKAQRKWKQELDDLLLIRSSVDQDKLYEDTHASKITDEYEREQYLKYLDFAKRHQEEFEKASRSMNRVKSKHHKNL